MTDVCSHGRSVIYYADSVKGSVYNSLFPAIRCTKSLFNQLHCTNDTTLMGFGVNMTAPEGDYYLMTNSNSVYDLGEAGIAPFQQETVIRDKEAQ